MPKKKIAIFFPYFIKGGSDVVVAQTIEALKNKYEVTLITFDKYEKINRFSEFYGAHFSKEDISIVNPPFSFLLRKIPGFGLFKYHLSVRYFKSSNMNFDVVLGLYKEIDFGRKGIQYIHVPELDIKDQESNSSTIKYYQNYFWGKIYKYFCYFTSGFNKEQMKKNITLVNSVWTKNIVKKSLGTESRVVYPPVSDNFPNIPFDEKENGFLCLGRIFPGKETDKIIRIIKKVRQNNIEVHLHIIGVSDDLNYIRFIKKLCSENSSWCFFEGEISGQKKLEFIAKHKYGILGCKNEAFGIAVAEMAKAGCIVFVPDGGGQTEIINNSQLIYKDEKDAVQKIINVLSNKNLQYSLQNHLFQRANLFSTERFIKDIKEITKNALIENALK